MNNQIPDIYLYDDGENPTIGSPYSPFVIQFYQTRESLANIEDYRAFLKNIEMRFRKSRNYKKYKSRLIESGMNRCQIHGNITTDMEKISIEMHHNMLTLFDIAMIISEHFINTVGKVSSFDVLKMIELAHENNEVLLCMLTKTPHEAYHDNPNFFIPLEACIGDPFKFLQRFRYGITQDIAYKILYYLNEEEKQNGKIQDNHILDVRNQILDWSHEF